jgi:branched-chain amino acid transport system ATP-binding protein
MNNPEAMDSSACKRAKEILEYVGLAQKADVQALSLPHGEQRLLGIGVALAANPKILLLDEPVGGMTHEEAEKVIDLIYDIRSEGMTVFFIEHNMGVVMNIAERVIVLDHGEQIAEGAPDQVKTNPRMIEAYLGKWE